MPKTQLIVVVIICIAIIGAYAAFSSKNPDNPGNDPSGPSDNGGFSEIDAGKGAHRTLLELDVSKDMAPPMEIRDGGEGPVLEASGAKCLYLGPEKWNELWKKGQVEGEYRKGHEEAAYPGYARYVVTVPETDNYALWLRAYWVDQCGNSVTIVLDGERLGNITSSTYGRWMWNPFLDSEAETRRIRLEKGKKYVLTICNREDDLYLDQVLLLGTDRPWPEPTGVAKE